MAAKPYQVYMNGCRVGTLEGRSKAAACRWLAQNLRDTRMGEWHRLPEGLRYSTTIGRYYTFSAQTTPEVLRDRASLEGDQVGRVV